MDFSNILAGASYTPVPDTTAGTEVAEEAFVPIDAFWEQITSLGLVEALTFISFGSICLFYGPPPLF